MNARVFFAAVLIAAWLLVRIPGAVLAAALLLVWRRYGPHPYGRPFFGQGRR
ncbi:hypothetical protein JGU71_16265 [Antrihabitans sp. YC3-6]|uniref:Uncharacterized protein n=1 Tax=Antrihabitans stalagmiti TaxID=2799499 RepID=A0A934NSJ0_9NOCA|nr:hypothetical protein [Antrihabitans stalagmiti]MBJ8340447.1 hypothetical protein [Antrihabitans stalagmiti]